MYEYVIMFIALFTVRYALSVQQRRVHFAGQEEQMRLLEEDSEAEEVTRMSNANTPSAL